KIQTCGQVSAHLLSLLSVLLLVTFPALLLGETVTVRCEIHGGEGAQWTYEWSPAKLNTPPTSNDYKIFTATESDRGEYSCRGRRGSFWTEWSDVITLTVLCKILLQHPQKLAKKGETITVRCEIHGGDTEWDYEWEANSIRKPPNQNEYRIRSASSSNSGNYRCKGRMKSSQHETTEWSDSVTLTVSDSLILLWFRTHVWDSGENSRGCNESKFNQTKDNLFNTTDCEL
uniref:Ig-like domain-containing protein n=1 Tax=Maylandia zebra TaxID=106582 RepID=A0A3P9D3S7_9CICH